MAKKKSKAKADVTVPRSEIIEQCVIYAQSIAAFNAGCEVDHTGDLDYGGSGKGQLGHRPLRKAKLALIRLIALSPAGNSGGSPLSREELLAKAGVMSIIGMETNSFKQPEHFEGAYIRFFAREVEDYLRAQE
jgi:hypothetical protein